MDHVARTTISVENLSRLLRKEETQIPKSIENEMLKNMVQNSYGLIEINEEAVFNNRIKRVAARVEWWRTEKEENLQIVPRANRSNNNLEVCHSIEIHQNRFWTNGLFVSDFIRTAAMEYFSCVLPPDNSRGICIHSTGLTTVGDLPNLLVFSKLKDQDNAWIVTPLGPAVMTIPKSWKKTFWTNRMGELVDEKNTFSTLRYTKYSDLAFVNENGHFFALKGKVDWTELEHKMVLSDLSKGLDR